MARLLYLPSSKAALEFCSSVGLPVEDENVIMKAAPVSVSKPETTLAWSRQEDAFVLDSEQWNGTNSRVDQVGILIPPASFLQSLITDEK